MAFNREQFTTLVKVVLRKMDAHSMSAVNLLLGTAAQESHFGTYITQIRGPAVGVFQMEPNTEHDIWDNYLSFRNSKMDKLHSIAGVTGPGGFHLWGNLIYQIMMTRYHYQRQTEPLPEASDIQGLAQYWKQYYNTLLGKGTVEEFVRNYKHYVGE